VRISKKGRFLTFYEFIKIYREIPAALPLNPALAERQAEGRKRPRHSDPLFPWGYASLKVAREGKNLDFSSRQTIETRPAGCKDVEHELE
jgi:hypothetical protein